MPASDYGSVSGRYYLRFNVADRASVLAEIGFLTNATDEALLRKPEHRQKIAEALYKGIASYASTLSHFQIAQN